MYKRQDLHNSIQDPSYIRQTLGYYLFGKAGLPHSRANYANVVDALAETVAGMQVGDPMDPATEIGPLVAQRQQERVEKYIALGQEEGARVVVGGNGRPAGLDKGWYVLGWQNQGTVNDPMHPYAVGGGIATLPAAVSDKIQQTLIGFSKTYL